MYIRVSGREWTHGVSELHKNASGWKTAHCANTTKTYLGAGTGSQHNRPAIYPLAGVACQALHHLIRCDANSRQVRPLQPVRLALDHMDAAWAQVGEPLL